MGSDHAGFALKEDVKQHLLDAGHDVEDLGTHSEDSVDYPLFAGKVARGVARDEADIGVLVCGTGLGMAISANKVRGARAVPAVEPYQAEMGRRHNDANVLTLAGRHTEPKKAFEIVDAFLATEFEGGRHQRRVDEIGDIEDAR
jgi:RpiB/LacA/LacB family sugar-phosphate isomerase